MVNQEIKIILTKNASAKVDHLEAIRKHFVENNDFVNLGKFSTLTETSKNKIAATIINFEESLGYGIVNFYFDATDKYKNNSNDFRFTMEFASGEDMDDQITVTL